MSDIVTLIYDRDRFGGRFSFSGSPTATFWARLRAKALDDSQSRDLGPLDIVVPWTLALTVLREFATRQQQINHGVRFRIEGEARKLAEEFARELSTARAAKEGRSGEEISEAAIVDRLERLGFSDSTRRLESFQLRDLRHLLQLANGANFSVPGAGKTTVALAVSLLARRDQQRLLVIAPKSAFPAWRGVIRECIDPSASEADLEEFVVLDGDLVENDKRLTSDHRRFVMSYDLMIRQQSILSSALARRPTHLILDEAHRMKAGSDSQRGSFLLSVAPLAVRRDILTGTPMPHGPRDIASQLAFLWPGHGYDLRVQRGETPTEVLKHLYVRTTKSELGLPPARRHFLDVEMAPAQLALYSLVRSVALRALTKAMRRSAGDEELANARRSVMRLLQLSSNPVLALNGIHEDIVGISSGVVQAVLEEGPSAKVRAVVDHARTLGTSGRKTVIWTIFTQTIHELKDHLADQNPVCIFGAVPSGSDEDPDTREARLHRFHKDDACRVLIANPAAAGEGISLHRAAHDAIYLDRTYVATHYLQSIDRIHRLGLAPDIETNIYIYRTRAPAEFGSIDYSVSRRLAKKIRGLQQLLNDGDLHSLALDEEEADDPVDYNLDLQDLVDLVAELEGRHFHAPAIIEDDLE